MVGVTGRRQVANVAARESRNVGCLA